MRTGAGVLTGAVLTVCVLAAGGYAWADAADLVPGVLTAQAPAPPPRPAAPEPVVQPPAGALAVTVPDVPLLGEAAPVDASALAAELAPLLADPALGPTPTLSVRDLATGVEVVTRASGTDLEPASTAKLVTAAAALEVLGAEHRLPTRVAWLPAAQRPEGRPAMVLVGGGDLLLGAGEGLPDATDGRVGLLDLARSAVLAAVDGPEGGRLLGPDVTVLDVVVDDSLLGSGPPPVRDPVDALFVSPPSSLAVSAGRREGAGRDQEPATTAGRAFAQALDQALAESQGVRGAATGSVTVSPTAVPTGPVLAEGTSAPVADVLGYLLRTSDNSVADAVAGLVALERGEPASPASAGAAVVAVVEEEVGVDLGATTLADGSGLGNGSLSSAAALSGLLSAAATAPPGDDLALLPFLLPVAGLDGTLASRFTSADGSAGGRGVVRAKTGTLTGVVALAGVGTTAQGRGVAFALVSGGVPTGGTGASRVAADRVAAAVATCC